MNIFDWFLIGGWSIAGILTLAGKRVTKVQYGACWFCLMIWLIRGLCR